MSRKSVSKHIRFISLLLAVIICLQISAFADESSDIVSCNWVSMSSDESFSSDELNGVPAYPKRPCSELAIRYYQEIYNVDIFVGYNSPCFTFNLAFLMLSGIGIPDYGDIPDDISGFKKTDTPKVGDIVYWSTSRRGKDYAHTALVKNYSDGVITLIEQNWLWNGKASYNRKIRFPSESYVVYTLSENTDTESVDTKIPENISVSASTHALEVDGNKVHASAYNIEGNNYFKLRDIAFLLKDTPARFSVDYDDQTKSISIFTGKTYDVIGGELDTSSISSHGILSPSNIYVNEKPISFNAYNIGGNNYFKLRELGDVLNFTVDYDSSRSTVLIFSE